MNLHDDPVRFLSPQRQPWRGSRRITQLHEKRHMKRAGEAGIALRNFIEVLRVNRMIRFCTTVMITKNFKF
jgi:hypothetical protein